MAADPGHRPQLVRLLQMILALGSGRPLNARELAELGEVSRRTVFRDLEALERAGVPVRYRSDRQAYLLDPSFRFEPPALEFEEAQALLLLARWGRGRLGPALARAAESGARKCVDSLADEPRQRLHDLADRLVGPPSALASRREPLYQTILQSLADRRQIRLHYREPGVEGEVATRFTPYRLRLEGDAWAILGRSSLHRDVRLIRLAWVVRVEPTADLAEIPPRLRDAPAAGRTRRRLVRLRLADSAAASLLDHPWASGEPPDWQPDGRLEVRLLLPDRDRPALLGRLLALGGSVEVVAPASLRRALRRLAFRAARLHGDPPQTPDPSTRWGVDSRPSLRKNGPTRERTHHPPAGRSGA